MREILALAYVTKFVRTHPLLLQTKIFLQNFCVEAILLRNQDLFWKNKRKWNSNVWDNLQVRARSAVKQARSPCLATRAPESLSYESFMIKKYYAFWYWFEFRIRSDVKLVLNSCFVGIVVAMRRNLNFHSKFNFFCMNLWIELLKQMLEWKQTVTTAYCSFWFLVERS